MPTTPLGENPYLYQGGPTVPLRQQKTGGYAANTFGNRVFYTPDGRLPNSTLAPGLAPTVGQIARQNLSGAGLVGAGLGGAVAAQSVYAQGGGLFQGLGAGLGTAGGGIIGSTAGAAAGAAAGGAAGSAVPVVGNVAGAGAGTVVGAIGGGLAGGAVGGSVGGAVGRAIDDFFWPDPGEPAIGIPDQPSGASSIPARGNGTPAGALGSGPVVVPGALIYGDPPFTGGQSPVTYHVSYQIRERLSLNNACTPWGDWSGTVSGLIGPNPVTGPITAVNTVITIDTVSSSANRRVQYVIHHAGGESSINLNGFPSRLFHTNCGVSYEYRNLVFTRTDGQPDTGGNPLGSEVGEIEPVRAPNPARVPYRPRDSDGQLSPFTRRSPAPTPGELPWPERKVAPMPDTAPFAVPAPFVAPEIAPNFTPTPEPEPERQPAPTRPTDPFNPGETKPLPETDPERRVAPPFIPLIPFPGINPPNVQVPTVPVEVPTGFRQPAITPTGSPQQLTNPTTAPQTNPNVKPTPQPTPQPVRIEQGNCCIPPPDPELVRRLEEIKKGIGFQGLPCSVPDQIAKDNPNQIQVGSLAELHLWQVQQLDGVMGRWPMTIPIPTPTQQVNVKMPNLSEAVAELTGMLVSQQVTSAQILNTASRTMAQAGSATQQAHLAHLTAKANAEFLGFESRPTEVSMPLTYTPGLDPFEGLLNESVAKVRGFANTDNQDLKSILAELLQAAAIIRAVYWRKLDPRGDLKDQIRTNIRGQNDFIDDAAAPTKEGKEEDAPWNAYIKQVEEGFSTETGETNPYGRPPEEGPKITDKTPKKDKKKK